MSKRATGKAPWEKDDNSDVIDTTAVEAAPAGDVTTMVQSGTALATTDNEDSALIPASEGAGDRYSTAPTFDAEDLLIPRLRLAQQMTQEVINGEAKMGQWVLIGNNAVDRATVIPVRYAKGRSRRDPEDPQRRTVLCSSPDAVMGIGDPGIACASCPFAKWTPNARSGKNDPPQCNLIYSYQCWSVTHQSMILLEFQGTAADAAKLINTIAMTRGLGKFAIDLASAPIKGARGTYAGPQVNAGVASPEDFANARAVFGV